MTVKELKEEAKNKGYILIKKEKYRTERQILKDLAHSLCGWEKANNYNNCEKG